MAARASLRIAGWQASEALRAQEARPPDQAHTQPKRPEGTLAAVIVPRHPLASLQDADFGGPLPRAAPPSLFEFRRVARGYSRCAFSATRRAPHCVGAYDESMRVSI